MKFYRIAIEDQDDRVYFQRSLAAAHIQAKNQLRVYWDTLYIDEIDVPVDKDTVLALLQGRDLPNLNAVKSWSMTKRGGLKGVEL